MTRDLQRARTIEKKTHMKKQTKTKNNKFVIGVISDTHGQTHPEIFNAFANVKAIIHAGDICGQHVLTELSQIAPVHAVRGNMDGWSPHLPLTEQIYINNLNIYVIHDLNSMDGDSVSEKTDIIISGHTHKPHISKHNGILYINPGSAKPSNSNATAALIYCDNNSFDAEIIELN